MKNTLKILKALSDKNRFRIVMILKKRNMCVCELFDILNISAGTLSTHLNILKNAEIIKQEKDGRWIEYSLSENKIIIDLINYIENITVDRSIIEDDRLKASNLSREECSQRYK